MPEISTPSSSPALPTSARGLWHRLRVLLSLNDPRWGRGDDNNAEREDKDDPKRQSKPPQDGPPDLDELWRDFNRRLNNLFGRKEGGNGNGPTPLRPGNGRAGSGLGVGVLLVVLAVLWLASGFFIVQEGQTGVILQFGRFKYQATPGINWRLPYPIETHEIVNLSGVRTLEIGRTTQIKDTNLKDSSMLTQDENIVDVRFSVQYNIADPVEYLFYNRTDQRGDEELVTQAAETSVREIVGRNKMDAVLYEGRDAVGRNLAESIQRILSAYKTGIRILSVNVQSVQPPEQVQSAFDDVTKAGQDRERAISEGQAYANDVVPRAKGTAARLGEEAQGYKARVVARAEGDAARFASVQREYAKAPQVTRDRIYLETMQDIYANATKVLVDQSGTGNLLYLPLDKLIAQSQTGDAARPQPVPGASPQDSGSAQGMPTPSNPSSMSDADSRSREALRNRERDSR
ncbi:FtsH protease activity modulator HflK [Ralstonia solanacearum]|uniref:FtsH protease activity modulator HflK n=1 Tax=Ralstonia pseudosolanacearum TaxID=1310165 RepID=UPI000B5E5634|nr:FtsH protease activity modulator HflK [Ralstonia pseudosolanacearum]QIK23248.1 FtsH protease activity modulator HflK [Ralstonia solanacearum]ASL72250.1 HflK protein [Ralstonia pseudosolanacearum]MCK4119806.1 FtsH protease activity modulator HflK [Ralstonia pseudosolanacearum]QIK28715.1 FtsH protease activity modulator HflK [Ralstonia solanacearum]QIK33622.1 FtsH protease activity modulator HflK [Ralstonia solanacearum]